MTNSIPASAFEQIPLLNVLPPKWQGPALLAFMVAPYATRIWHGFTSGGGLKGAWNALWFGTNTPKPPQA